MHKLGLTRSARERDHMLQTPDSFVRAPLPGMRSATAVIHAAPAIGAKFVQYTAEFEAGGTLGSSSAQRFLYVLEGEIRCEGLPTLGAGAYAYFPAQSQDIVCATTAAKAMAIEKPYEPLDGQEAPKRFAGREKDVEPQPLLGDPSVEVRALLPGHLGFDFAVNVMTYQPGATLPMVEAHVMEHGLFMLAGGGIYRLNDRWYPVAAGDFIWMAPYCPQWFGALGKEPAKYLIYKDWNRTPGTR